MSNSNYQKRTLTGTFHIKMHGVGTLCHTFLVSLHWGSVGGAYAGVWRGLCCPGVVWKRPVVASLFHTGSPTGNGHCLLLSPTSASLRFELPRQGALQGIIPGVHVTAQWRQRCVCEWLPLGLVCSMFPQRVVMSIQQLTDEADETMGNRTTNVRRIWGGARHCQP